MWVDPFGNFYEGDCQPGDRAATPEELAARDAALMVASMTAFKVTFLRDREPFMGRLESIAGRASRAGDNDTAAVCDTVANSLIGLSKYPTVLAATDLVSLKAAMKARYDAIIAAVPVNVKQMFKEMGQ